MLLLQDEKGESWGVSFLPRDVGVACRPWLSLAAHSQPPQTKTEKNLHHQTSQWIHGKWVS